MDDMPILSKMYGEFLSRHGFQPEIGTSADQAYEHLHDGRLPPDVLILDVNVQGSMNGIELCRKLRQESRYQRLAIIILTANPSCEAEAWEAGCDAFFTKPCRLDELLETVDALTRVT